MGVFRNLFEDGLFLLADFVWEISHVLGVVGFLFFMAVLHMTHGMIGRKC